VLIFGEDEEVVEGVVRRMYSLARQWPGPWEVICVDRSSRDGTGAILERLCRSLPGLRLLRWREDLSSSPLEAAYFAAAYPLVLFVDRRGGWQKAAFLPTFLVGRNV
jgi:cellulose synthase/poly-beta-1,6-N-acetylglucosamine synthase-like glycosyltransferase